MSAGRNPPIPLSRLVISRPMISVDSSAVTEVGYDDHLWCLYVTYRPTGMTYIYTGVPPNIYEQMMDHPSIGTFVNTVLKPNYYCIPE